MNKQTIIGIDLGGTNIRGGLVKEGILSGVISERVNASATETEMLQSFFEFTDRLLNPSVKAIGIGVPGLAVGGVVYDVVNIPSWKKIPLQNLMEERYQIPVSINNDANCFALGEFYFGKGAGYESMVGLTIGTGLGAGIIINNQLYTGSNCSAGEFGMIEYLGHCYEYYASGQFFENVYGISGEKVFRNASAGNSEALRMYKEMGGHLGNAIKTILYATDVPFIVLGGSVSRAYCYFAEYMWQQLQMFAFKRTIENLRIEVTGLKHSSIMGAAALHLDRSKTV